MSLITGAHVMIFTRDEDADRAFLRDVLEIPCIDGGGGWLISSCRRPNSASTAVKITTSTTSI